MSVESSPLVDPDGLVGRVLAERYLIEERLGEGGMGSVYRAAHVKVGRTFAIKVLHPELLRNEKVVWRFEREAESAARMRHPNVVPALDVGTTEEGMRYLVMDFVDGPDLAEVMLEAPMPPPRVIWLVRQILEGLQHAHHHGLVHRDLKPQNIIVETDADGREIPRIVDFGISILATDQEDEGSRLTTSGMVLGTPLYMAPEQAVAGEIDHRVDLFALGLIVYEMLSGALPFDGTGAQVARANLMLDPPAMSKRVPELSVDPLLEAFTRRLMARDRDLRPSTAREARELLDLIERDRKAAAAVLAVANDAAPSQILTVPRLPSVSGAPDGGAAKLVDVMAVTENSDKVPAGSAPIVMVQEEGSDVVVSLSPLGESGPVPAGPPAGPVELSHVRMGRPPTGQPTPATAPHFPGDPPPLVAQPFRPEAGPPKDRRAERYQTTEHGYRHAERRSRRWVVMGSLGGALVGMVIVAMVVKSGPAAKAPPEGTAGATVEPVAAPAASVGAAADPSVAPEPPPGEPSDVAAPPGEPSDATDRAALVSEAPDAPMPSAVASKPAKAAAATSAKPEPKLGAKPEPKSEPKLETRPTAAKPEPAAPEVQPAAPVSLTKRYTTVGNLIFKLPVEQQKTFLERYRRINKDDAAGDAKKTAAALKLLDEIERGVQAALKP